MLNSRPTQHGWQPVPTAPYDGDLELAVIDLSGVHALVFPCRRTLKGWIDATTKRRVEVWPTHWRAWTVVADDPQRPHALCLHVGERHRGPR